MFNTFWNKFEDALTRHDFITNKSSKYQILTQYEKKKKRERERSSISQKFKKQVLLKAKLLNGVGYKSTHLIQVLRVITFLASQKRLILA